jgi:hypothetical protein
MITKEDVEKVFIAGLIIGALVATIMALIIF